MCPKIFPFFVCFQEKWRKIGKVKKAQKGNYGRMLALAAHALAEVLSSLVNWRLRLVN